MKIIGINGSPRINGNSAQLLEIMLKQTEQYGASIKTYHLNKMNFKGCQGCSSCREKGNCILKDDMNILLKEVKEADVVILSTPVYMWQMSAQTKLFTDRLMPLLKSDYSSRLMGQKLLMLYTQGNTNCSQFSSYFEYTKNMFTFLGFRVLPPFVAGGFHHENDIQKYPNIIQRAKQSAEAIMMADCF